MRLSSYLCKVLMIASALCLSAPVMAKQALPITEGKSAVKHVKWAHSANIYEVNIRQYTPEGTFRAFEAHLPRLQKMGVKILWIMPINPISQLKRKGSLGSYYAVSDYKAINPEYGTLDDFKHLVNTAHKMGFKVIVDWVANHTGWDNIWVDQHPDWYLRNAKGELQGYTYTDLSTKKVEVWEDVIGLDYAKPEVRAAMIDAMSYWIKETNIDGFRCDVAWTLPVAFWDEARAKFDAIKPVFLLAEADTPDMQMNAFDMTYDWTLTRTLIKVAKGQADARDVARLYTDPERKYPEGAYRMIFTSNHDENSWNGTDRELFGEAFEIMAVLAQTLPGMPLIYGGQEAELDKRLKFFDKDAMQWRPSKRAQFYAKWLRFKTRHPALSNALITGNLVLLDTDNPKVLAFERRLAKDRVRVVANLSSHAVVVTIKGGKPLKLKGWGYRVD